MRPQPSAVHLRPFHAPAAFAAAAVVALVALVALVAVLLAPPPALAQEDAGVKQKVEAGVAAAAFQSTFCDGTYALCIEAPCSAIPTLNRIGNYYVNSALCECDVVDGWSMGPGSCPDRAPIEQHGRTFLISTYSNLDNAEESTLACDSPDTLWAWCYGAPCVVDEKDPSKATCTCPVQTGPSRTLGGDCKQASCDGIWSAATPAGDVFANTHYYEWMTKNQPGTPVNGPAPACGASSDAMEGGVDGGGMSGGR
jgi:hypothetical protein